MWRLVTLGGCGRKRSSHVHAPDALGKTLSGLEHVSVVVPDWMLLGFGCCLSDRSPVAFLSNITAWHAHDDPSIGVLGDGRWRELVERLRFFRCAVPGPWRVHPSQCHSRVGRVLHGVHFFVLCRLLHVLHHGGALVALTPGSSQQECAGTQGPLQESAVRVADGAVARHPTPLRCGNALVR